MSEKKYVNAFKLMRGLDQAYFRLLEKDGFSPEEHNEMNKIENRRMAIAMSPAGKPMEMQDWMREYL